MAKLRTVYAGICRRNDELVCGITEEPQDGYCDEGTWIPPHVVADSGYEHRTCAYYPRLQLIGRCGDEGPCSNLAERCDDPSSFINRDPTCSITHDSRPNDEDQIAAWDSYFDSRDTPFSGFTTYGRCDDRCVWSPKDCQGGEIYVRNDPKCTADKVSLGACLDGFGYCTVSNSTCTNLDGITKEPYYSHDEFLEFLGVNCILGTLPPIRSKSPPTAAPTQTPTTMVPTSLPTLMATEGTPTTVPSTIDNDTTLTQGAVIGIAVSTAVVGGIFIGFLRSRCQPKSKSRSVVKKPPTASINFDNGGGVGDDEELSVT